MKRLDKLKQQGFGFEEAPAEGLPARKCDRQCRWIFREGYEHVKRFADYVDLLRAQCPDLPASTLSIGFITRDRELTAAIEAEWNKASPELDAFKELCDLWQALCLAEIKSWVEILRQDAS